MTATISATDVHLAPDFDHSRQRAFVHRELARQSFCTIATTSAAHRPHVAGVLYNLVDGAFYISMHDDSVKIRNLRENPRVAICVPVRKIPFAPPFAIQLQGTAEILSVNDPEISALLAAGQLKKIAASTDFADLRSCFVRITPGQRVSTYGLGVPLLQVIKSPTTAMRTVDFRPLHP